MNKALTDAIKTFGEIDKPGSYKVFPQMIKPLNYSILLAIFLYVMVSQVIGAEDQVIQPRILG